MDKIDLDDDDWDAWGVPMDEELKNDADQTQKEDTSGWDNFAEPSIENELVIQPLDIGVDVKKQIESIMSENQKYVKQVADFNAKPKQSFTAERYPNGFKLATY